MLKCHACLRHHITNLIAIYPPAIRAFTASAVVTSGLARPPGRRTPLQSSRGNGRRPDNFVRISIPRGLEGEHMTETRDPIKLVAQVERYLSVNDVAKAHRLVENASRKINTVVAWNRLMQHAMEINYVPRALRFYNDMKKRGIKPDSYTYIHLLSGFASQPKLKPIYVAEAFKIYEHLKTKNDNVELSRRHTNALLSVCMKANDMDRAWQILSTLPSYGPNSPDATTYTVFLRGLRGQGEESIADGKRAWAGALARFNRRDLLIDEYLGNAYLDLLLHGPSPTSWRELFVVAHQLFDLPLPRNAPEHRPDHSFRNRWLEPDDFTLGILLKGAEKLKDIELAKLSWDVITHRVIPSQIALHRFLRCASICHAGSTAVEVLSASVSHMKLTEWNYVMGLRACVHSGGTYESFENANSILALAEKDGNTGLLVTHTYLLVALTTTDARIVKRALLRIEKYLKPASLENWRSTTNELPRDRTETIQKFIATLKKAVFWDNLHWGRYEESRWMDKFREVKKTLRDWGEVVGNDLVEERKILSDDPVKILPEEPLVLPEPQMLAMGTEERLQKVMADLRKFSPKQRRRFIESL
ncbi:hypothetical protein BDD12DRAFT_853758 [Trichophaea hybrida]|nr:hypothetical protein BDD12DRAFT_853758 [Trichophaea hybrida]